MLDLSIMSQKNFSFKTLMIFTNSTSAITLKRFILKFDIQLCNQLLRELVTRFNHSL